MDAIDKAVNAGLEACDLFDVVNDDILTRKHLRIFLSSALLELDDELRSIIRDALPEMRHAATAEARRSRVVGAQRTDRRELLERAEKALR